jgi:uncharacterized membrane protein YedE/YeeE
MHIAENTALQNGIIGGIVIGLSASGFMYCSGKISGLSGIVEGIITSSGEGWHYSYVSGLLSSGLLCHYLFPNLLGEGSTNLSVLAVVVGGFLSGFGTRLSGGCTSGHGLCGLGRFSPRSLTSVVLFMASGMVTAHYGRGYFSGNLMTLKDLPSQHTLALFLPAAVVLILGSLKNTRKTNSAPSSFSMHAVSFLSAFVFGSGLCISGMCTPERIIRFLDFAGKDGWDYTLTGVLGAGLAMTSFFFPFMKKHNLSTLLEGKPLGNIIKIGTAPENLVIDWKLITGSLLFGVGWGLTGLCPGPGIVTLTACKVAASVYVPSLLAGILVKDSIFNR